MIRLPTSGRLRRRFAAPLICLFACSPGPKHLPGTGTQPISSDPPSTGPGATSPGHSGSPQALAPSCSVLIVGASTGGVAAALTAAMVFAREGSSGRVCLTEETSWIGGQFTSQALGLPDEEVWSNDQGSSHNYRLLRDGVRSILGASASADPGNAWGSDLVAAPPPIWKQQMDAMLAGQTAPNGGGSQVPRIVEYLNYRPTDVLWDGANNRVIGATFAIVDGNDNPTGQTDQLSAPVVVDGTDMGDLLAFVQNHLGQPTYRVGQETAADTGEVPSSVSGSISMSPQVTTGCEACVQSITTDVLVELCPEASDAPTRALMTAIANAQPSDYGIPSAPYTAPASFALNLGSGETVMVNNSPFLTYRRLLEQTSYPVPALSRCPSLTGDNGATSWANSNAQTHFGDIAVINWGGSGESLDGNGNPTLAPGGNDYVWGQPVFGATSATVDYTNRQSVANQARQRALAFVYWLQHNVPRDSATGPNPITGGQTGYPSLIMRGDLTGRVPSPPTSPQAARLPDDDWTRGLPAYAVDGSGLTPYVREGRRLRAQTTIRVDDIGRIHSGGSSTFYRGAGSWDDAVGIGRYLVDIHTIAFPPAGTGIAPQGGLVNTALPSPSGRDDDNYQFPLGALIPAGFEGLIAGGKALGTTHLSNAALRLHPTEWAIGEAAGVAAAIANLDGDPENPVVGPTALYVASHQGDRRYERRVQEALCYLSSPIYWVTDISSASGTLDWATWADFQLVAGAQILPGTSDPTNGNWSPQGSLNEGSLAVALARALGRSDSDSGAQNAVATVVGGGFNSGTNLSTTDQLAKIAQAVGCGMSYSSSSSATRVAAARMLAAVLRQRLNLPGASAPSGQCGLLALPPGSLSAGSACNVDGDCNAGNSGPLVCPSGVCLLPLGASCSNDSSCNGGQPGTGEVCSSNSQTCIDACHSNGDCAASLPVCSQTASPWACVASAGPTASVGSACTTAADCNGGNPGPLTCPYGVCLAPPGASCSSDASCNGGKSGQAEVCSSNSQTCITACHGNSDCPAGTPFCSQAVSPWACVAIQAKSVGSSCSTASDCNGGGNGQLICPYGICLAPLGTSCNSDATCNGGKSGQAEVCGGSASSCISACHSNSDCPQSAPTCNQSLSPWACVRATGKSVGSSCNSAADCNGGASGPLSCPYGICLAPIDAPCSGDASCNGGKSGQAEVCSSNSMSCIDACHSNGDCPPNAPVCDQSLSTWACVSG